MDTRRPPIVLLKVLLFVAALLPLSTVVGIEESANPVQELLHASGDWALRFLLITLAITPLRRFTGWGWPVRLRRMLGLFAFFYALLHLAIYVGLDLGFRWGTLGEDIAKRPYITLGLAVILMLLPLAITSTDAMIRRLGGRRWRGLHRLVYPAALGAVAHYLWLVKADLREPLIYLGILCLLLALRLPWPRQARTPHPSGV